jgi:hypothetical protein
MDGNLYIAPEQQIENASALCIGTYKSSTREGINFFRASLVADARAISTGECFTDYFRMLSVCPIDATWIELE